MCNMMMFVLISPFFMVRSIQNTIVGGGRSGHWQFSTGCIESGQSQKQQHNSTR